MNRQEPVSISSPAVWMPDDIKGAWKLKRQYGSGACLIAGGTHLQTLWEKGMDCPPHLISLEGIKEMLGWRKELVQGGTFFRIGALTSLEDCGNHPEIVKEVPLLAEAVSKIAAPAIRNKATIGGNISNGLGDTIPAFLVLDTCLSLFDGMNFHLQTLVEYMKEPDSHTNSILVCVYVPEKSGDANRRYFYKKLGYREAFSPSIVTISGCFSLNEQGEVEFIRLAAGGGTSTPQRLVGCEKLLKGAVLSNDVLHKTVQAITEEFICRTDPSFSAEFKKNAAANMMVSEIARLGG